MSSNYANYRNYYQNQRINTHPSYQTTYYNGKVVVKRPKQDHSIIKKNVLGKFEKLEHKLLDYLSEFVKYSESCRIPPKKPIPYGAKGSKYTLPIVNRSASPSRGRSTSPAARRAALPTHRRSASPDAPPNSKRSASQSPQRIASQIPKRSASQGPKRDASASPKPAESACPKPAVSPGLKSVATTDPKRTASPAPTRAAQKPTKQGEPHIAIKKYRRPTNLEKKIGQIEEKTRNIQKYNKLLEQRFQKYKLSSENHGSIIMDANLKDVIIKEVKNLEEILIEKRLEDQNLNIKNIPEYEKCHGMLQECIKMLGDAIREEKDDKKKNILKEKEEKLKKSKKLHQPPSEKNGKIDSKPKTVIKGKPKALIECKPKLFKLKTKEPEDMSDDEFFNQYNLDISDYECYKEGGKELGKDKQETVASGENEDVAIPAEDDGEYDNKAEDEAAEADDEETDDEEAAEAEDKLGPLQDFSSRHQEREDQEPEQEDPEPEPVLQPKSVRKTKSVPHPISVPRPKSVAKSESVPEPKFIETDRRKLIQIQEELRSLEYNNKKFLNVVHGLRKNLNTKDIEETVFVPRNEFLNEVYQIREASSNIERSERNVEKLISHLKIL